MGANAHYKRLVCGRFFVYEHKVSIKDDLGRNDGATVLYDLYDPFADYWLGTYSTFGLAFAAAREAQRKEFNHA